ncbi:polycomb group protein EMBRYONIC FLOWER 2-like isoform X2 [Rutidosis leptorrhynchoides]|uniref:polycomb group protein EMBRYONIC FLOWER 2-like isoform X2 n=1 Tax=Rutidosis leptorrhynchoides TaxID=125765 RepID=UPI003A99064F
MPGITLAARKSICSLSRDQMCRRGHLVQLSAEEEIAAEESLAVYCKPVELYNIIQRRTIRNPLFLQRCLHYKLQAKNKRRQECYNRKIQISVSVSGAIDDGMDTQSLFPFYVLLARQLSTANVERSAVYRFSHACKLTTFGGAETSSSARAKYILPEISKLSAEVKSGSLAMLLVSCVDITNPQGIDLTEDRIFSASSNFGGYCLLGKIPLDLLHLERSPNLSLGGRAETRSTVSMRSCYMKLSGLDEEKCVSFQFPHNSEAVSILQQVPLFISAEELGAKDISAYDLYSYSDIPDDALPHIMRLRTGNVIFNYKYYNDTMQRTEVTEDYTCPFCLVRCASYKGLRFHLTSSHDLFNFEFWVNEDYQVVNVSVKVDINKFEFGVVGVADPRKEAFSFCHRPLRRRKLKCRSKNENRVQSLPMDSDVPEVANCISNANSVSVTEPDSVHSVSGSNLTPPTMLQFAKTRKLSIERSDPRSRALLQKRQFFHSHRAQPMAMEQILADEDSEDEVDDDVADLEDRRMLDDFVDVTEDEKHMMHLWNSFIRKQRVLADSHTPWACEAFSKLHGQEFAQNPPLLWCWKVFMIKLWNHGLLDQRAMNNCNLILEQYQDIDTASVIS